MCFCTTLEICCAEEPTNSFPTTLNSVAVIVLCHAAKVTQKLEQVQNGVTCLRIPMSCAENCPNFDASYIRCERVFWSSCDSCIDNILYENDSFTEEDQFLAYQYNNMLRAELLYALYTRPYEDVVLSLSAEFGIHARFLLSGQKWVALPEPVESNVLGTNPPLDYDYEGLEWWIEQKVDLSDQLWDMFCRYVPMAGQLWNCAEAPLPAQLLYDSRSEVAKALSASSESSIAAEENPNIDKFHFPKPVVIRR